MCQYSCEQGDGLATDWHVQHLTSRAVGGAGIVMSEATAVDQRGRITPTDLGLWSDEHADALADIAAFVRDQGSLPGIQLVHAGRFASLTAASSLVQIPRWLTRCSRYCSQREEPVEGIKAKIYKPTT